MHPPGNSCSSDVVPVPLCGHDHKTYQSSHTEIYAIKCKSNFFSIFISRTIDANDFFGTKCVVIDESSFLYETSREETKCKKSDVFCEIDKDPIRLFNGLLELTEEKFARSFQTAEVNVIWKQMKLKKIKAVILTRRKKRL